MYGFKTIQKPCDYYFLGQQDCWPATLHEAQASTFKKPSQPFPFKTLQSRLSPEFGMDKGGKFGEAGLQLGLVRRMSMADRASTISRAKGKNMRELLELLRLENAVNT